ncbi:MAG: hypothetical protein QMC98_00195 [Candidatus Thermoplasmatota archaeon]|nr:hypothetical protein [Candidatus Thermoplasmatota archaeon]
MRVESQEYLLTAVNGIHGHLRDLASDIQLWVLDQEAQLKDFPVEVVLKVYKTRLRLSLVLLTIG